MKLFSFLGTKSSDESSELPEIYPLALKVDAFVKADMQATYTKILIDVLERTSGITPEIQPLLWDNCVQNEHSDGLVTLLATAMVNKSDLFLVYKASMKLLRLADAQEQQRIKEDYAKTNESSAGVYVSFKNYKRTEMLFIYSAMEYCILASLYKTVNISKAVQIKMSDLRASVSLTDSGIAIAQAKSLAEALGRGSDVFLDVKDEITNATPDVGPTEKAIAFLDAKRAYLLNLPLSYIAGEQTPGIGSTGEADMRAVERGLKQYFFSIVKPVTETLFNVKTDFKSQDFRQMTSALEALKTFELVSDNAILSKQSMQEIIARLFDLDVNAERKALEKELADAPDAPPEDIVDPQTVDMNKLSGAKDGKTVTVAKTKTALR